MIKQKNCHNLTLVGNNKLAKKTATENNNIYIFIFYFSYFYSYFKPAGYVY